MAKFIKSIFQPNEKLKKTFYEEGAEETDFTPPLDERRKLSISRSGRLKAAQKLRRTLSVEVFRGEELQYVEKPKSLEYHVNPTNLSKTAEPMAGKNESITQNPDTTPEEEIDHAFEIIDKS